ncbi:MAG: FAD-binding oxidoreductase [Ardenticatenaceae bacterium]|nr:FAD-binding oxidoreductase [Ardenticatenaceae bacterium]
MRFVGYEYDMVYSELTDVVGEQFILTDKADRIVYGVDHYWVSEAWFDRNQELPLADFIVRPRSVDEIARIMKIAARYRIPVVPWGLGSGSQGGALPIFGGILLDLKRLDRILEINETNLTVTAEAGINGQRLEDACNYRGLTLPHYPASHRVSTLGGWLAPRGSGVLSTKYGKAEDLVLTIQVVLPSGDIIRTLPTPSHAAGPDLRHLFVGAEGTTGVITEATMRLEPLPEVRRFRSYLFKNLLTGLEAGRRIMTRRLHPCVIRLYDEFSTTKELHRVLGVTREGAYMVVGFDGYEELVALEEKQAFDICTALGGEDLGREAGHHWWEHRYDFYYPPRTKSLPKLFGTTDVQAPYDKIAAIYHARRQLVEGGYKGWGARYFCHFSHWYPWGTMMYDQFLIEAPPDDPHEAVRLHNRIWWDVVRIGLRLGGVLNEHHGVGMKMGYLMPEQYGSAWPVLQAVKNALDPRGIMNPGKLGFEV